MNQVSLMLPAWILFATAAWAQTPGTDFADASNLDPAAGWAFAASWAPASGTDGFGMTDLRLSKTWTWLGSQGGHPVSVTPGLGVHFPEGLPALELPDVLYDVYLDVAWRVVDRAEGGISLGVTPGLYGDLQRVSHDSFQVTGWVLGDYQLSPHWTLVGGVAVVRQLRSHWLPVGGLIWAPTEDWQLDFTIPRPRVARRVHQTEAIDVWAYLAGQFGGGSWAVDDGTGGNGLLVYSDLRLVAGLNLWQTSGRELSCEAGYVFSRDLSFDDVSIASPPGTWVRQGVFVF